MLLLRQLGFAMLAIARPSYSTCECPPGIPSGRDIPPLAFKGGESYRVRILLKATVRYIDALNEYAGRAVSWLVILMVFTTFGVAVLRYGFSVGWVWLQESYVWMHGIIFMVAAGYTLLHDGHVRIDIVYRAVRARTRAWINLLGVVFLLLPTLAVVWWAS